MEKMFLKVDNYSQEQESCQQSAQINLGKFKPENNCELLKQMNLSSV